MTLVQKEPKYIKIGSTDVKKVYYGGNQVRPIIKEAIVDLLLVGGGGAGGRSTVGKPGGGGGGGGVVHCCSISITTGTYNIIIGAGGTGTNSTCLADDIKGGDSCFGTIVAYGGGGGGAKPDINTGGIGGNGGSGGGGAPYRGTGGSGYAGQGNSGGNGSDAGYVSGGGGGGYSMAGLDYGRYCLPCPSISYTAYGGAGGCGYYSDISGAGVWYGSGGSGGGCCSTNGRCGGGKGGNCYISGVKGGNATTYGSGGGGAGCYSTYNCSGGNGCQGIFILRYPTACGYNVSGGCKYTCGDYTIHCFTSNGSLTVS